MSVASRATIPFGIFACTFSDNLSRNSCIRGLCGKMDELNILVSHCPKLHILAFTESKLDNSISDGEVSLPGYSIFRSDQTNGRGVGIAVYVKETLSVIRRSDLIWKRT